MVTKAKPSIFIFSIEALIDNSNLHQSLWSPIECGFRLLNSVATKGETIVLVPSNDTGEANFATRRAVEQMMVKYALAPSTIRVVSLPQKDDSRLAKVEWFKSMSRFERMRVRLAFEPLGVSAVNGISLWNDLGVDACCVAAATRK